MSSASLHLHVAGDVGIQAIAEFLGVEAAPLQSKSPDDWPCIGQLRVSCSTPGQWQLDPLYAGLPWRWVLAMDCPYSWWEIRDTLALALCDHLAGRGGVAFLGQLDTGEGRFFVAGDVLRIPEENREYFSTFPTALALFIGDVPEFHSAQGSAIP